MRPRNYLPWLAAIYVALGASQIVPTPIAQDHRRLARAALHAIERYISPLASTLVVKESCSTCSSEHVFFHNRMLNYMLRSFDKSMTLQLHLAAPNDQPWDYNVFIIDSYKSFEMLQFHFSESLCDREFYFLIILTYRVRVGLDLNIRRIFLTCLRARVLNVMLLVEESRAITFFSYKLFGPLCDSEITIYAANSYVDGRLTHDMLFAPRFSNLFNCPLNVSWYPLPPFVTFDGDIKNRSLWADANRLSGLDAVLLRLLADSLQFRINLLAPCEKSFIDDDGNATGCFSELISGNADIAIGGLSGSYLWRHFFSTTIAYDQNSYVFVVRNDHRYGPISQLVSPFAHLVWYALLAILACAVLLQKFYGFGKNNPLYLWTTLLGNPLQDSRLPKRDYSRFLLMSWVVMALILRGAYQGKLYDKLRSPACSGVPQRIYELLRGNYTLLSSHYVDFYPYNSTLILPASYGERFRKIDADESYGKKLMTISLLANLGHYSEHCWPNSSLTYVKESIYMYQLVMYLRKHSVLKFAFDDKLKRLMQSGIISHANKQFEPKKYKLLQENMKFVQSIKLSMFCGLFSIYMTLLGCASAVFVAECIVHRWQIVRKRVA